MLLLPQQNERQRGIHSLPSRPEAEPDLPVSTAAPPTQIPTRWSELRAAGHFPTLVSAFLYFDFSFMVWTLLGILGAQIAAPDSLHLSPGEKGFMVATPILSGAILRILLGLGVDRFGAKNTGIFGQCVVIAGLATAWMIGLKNYHATLLFGLVLGFAGASFAVALPQAGRWYPPRMQGLVLGLAGAGNIGVVLDALFAPRLARLYGWQNVFGLALIPAALVLLTYICFSKEPPEKVTPKKFAHYIDLFRQKDTHWFCFYYTISFGGFAGLASSFVIFFQDQYALPVVNAGDLAALCAAAGTLARPLGGALADAIGGIRSLSIFYCSAGLALASAAFSHNLPLSLVALLLASAAFGSGNGAVFQLLPQRFGKDFGLITGLVGCGGGIGGFLLASMLGLSRHHTGTYAAGFFIFAALCFAAFLALGLVKHRWRKTWGPATGVRI